MSMNSKLGNRVKPRLFYGWWIVLAGFAVVFYGLGTGENVLVQLPDLLRVFDGSYTTVGMTFSIYRLTGAIALLAMGPLIDRFGPRKTMLVGIPLAGISSLCLSFVNNMPALYVVLGTLGLGISAGFLLPVQTATANWFIRRRSLALAVISAAAFLGGAITTLFGERVAAQLNGQGAFLGMGAVMLVLGVPLALVFRHRPEQYGYLPDGELPAIENTSQPVTEEDNRVAETNFSLRQALRTRAFWMLTIGVALASGAGMTTLAYRVPFLIDKGFDYIVVANMFDNTALMGLVGILLFGYLGDMFPKRHLLAIAIALQSASVVILMTSGSVAQVYLYTLVYGLGSGMVPLILAIRTDYFGRRAFATITVVMMFIGPIIGMPVSAGLPLLAGWMFDITRSYQLVFFLSMLIGFIPATVFFFARPPALPQPALTPTDS